MSLQWTESARSDLLRIHAFLAPVNPVAAAQRVALVLAGVERLAANPRLGRRLEEFAPREVRRLLVGDYELRYELTRKTLFVLRVWHTREDR